MTPSPIFAVIACIGTAGFQLLWLESHSQSVVAWINSGLAVPFWLFLAWRFWRTAP